ncbi:hypothetical protein E4T44_10125 [Aureobasidium sp. EXF-8845]|nr:hypothetical protein E4T44_10125 [Aureobasidium sp. EXF-8845]KAI4841125.1 hypothetical protein E4T45_09486 [Aureobasidium sp. EXF-8846]
MSLSQSPYLINTAGVIGHLLVLGGSGSILSPRSVIGAFGLDTPSTPEAQRLVDLLVPLYGFREVSLGLSMVAVWRYGSVRTLGWTTLSVVVTALGDGWIARKQRKGLEWVHWGLIPVALGVGAGLLGYFD